MLTLNPYLNFNDNAEEAFNFYKSVFGGEFAVIQRFKDTPEAGKVPEREQNMIMHVSLPIGKGNVLMGSDVSESMRHNLVEGNNFYISINTESEEEANKLFDGLSAEGKIELAMQKTFWGAYFGMFADKFSIHWMINCEGTQQQKPAE